MTRAAIDRVEILVPLPQLEKINIVDTPGLNSIQPEHEATARAFIARADAVVWVFTANAGRQGEREESAAVDPRRGQARARRAEQGRPALAARRSTRSSSSSAARSASSSRRSSRCRRARRSITSADEPATTATGPALLGGARGALLPAGAPAQARCVCTRAARRRRRSAERARAVAAARRRGRGCGQAARDELVASARAVRRRRRRRRAQGAVGGDGDALSPRGARGARSRAPAPPAVLVAHRDRRGSRLPDRAARPRLRDCDRGRPAARRRRARDPQPNGRAAARASRRARLDVVGDLERVAADRIGLAMSRVFDRARAYLRGYIEGGYVEAFFRNDVPRLELAEDAIYHALYRSAPDLDREVGDPLAQRRHRCADRARQTPRSLAGGGRCADVRSRGRRRSRSGDRRGSFMMSHRSRRVRAPWPSDASLRPEPADARDRRGRPRPVDRSDGDGCGSARLKAAAALTRKGLRDSKAYGAGDDAHAIRCELAAEVRRAPCSSRRRDRAHRDRSARLHGRAQRRSSARSRRS